MTVSHINHLYDILKETRKRHPVPNAILQRAFREVDKIKKIPFKKGNYPSEMYWGDNPHTDNSLTIDLPHIELDTIYPLKTDFIRNAVFYDEKKVKQENIKYVEDSCVITYKGEIMMVYITEKTDRAITKATERIKHLVPKFELYYPVKSDTFYTPFKISTTKTPSRKEKTELNKFKASYTADPRYYGKNWMDGMIRYFQGMPNKKGGTHITYQPRDPASSQDEEFLFDLVYTYCALYELEKRYAPDVATYRLELAKNAGFVGAIPNVPLERHCATGMGASLDFSSAIHNDSGMSGLSETIIWDLPAQNEKQYFISPTIKLVFDLTKHRAIILQPPKIPHSTLSTGNHKGVGLVNITKANLVANTKLTSDWYGVWRKHLK